MNLQDVTDELYSLPLQEFTAARNARAKELRRRDRGLADEVKGLPKPTAAAWALNALARRHPDELTPLLDLGRDLRDAQQDLAGASLRELSARTGAAVSAVVERVRAGAAASGTALSDAAARDVQHTLRAAMADQAAERAVRAGVLVRPLQPPGFAGLDLSDAVAAPADEQRGGGRAPGRTSTSGTGRSRAPVDRARQAAQTALEELEQADDELARQEARLDEAAAVQESARQRVEDLRQELGAAEQDETRAATATRVARDERDAARRRARSARRKAEGAQGRLDAAG